jgi:hypothetical protein
MKSKKGMSHGQHTGTNDGKVVPRPKSSLMTSAQFDAALALDAGLPAAGRHRSPRLRDVLLAGAFHRRDGEEGGEYNERVVRR